MDLIHVARKGRYRAIPYENLSFANEPVQPISHEAEELAKFSEH